MRRVIQQIERVAQTSASVLILGETGSGKEIIARAIHHFSPRSSKPWVDVNCAALPDQLMESELFGHERGAFSGADTAKPGLFEMANHGTLLLDEVGELELRMQVKLLRVLDGVPYYRLGGQKKVQVDTRVLAATNQDLAAAVGEGSFRSDLFHRLNQWQVRVPPLRERVEDIVPLAEHFLLQQSQHAYFSDAAKKVLERHTWPGNARELRNAVIAAIVNSHGEVIEAQDIQLTQSSGLSVPSESPLRLDGLEKEAIMEALRKTHGHHQRAADLLGISRRTLTRRLNLYRPERRRETDYEYGTALVG